LAGGAALDLSALQQAAQQRAERLGGTDIDQMVQSQKASDQLIAELKKGVKLKERVVKEKEERELDDIKKDLEKLESRFEQKKISEASYNILKGKLEDERSILEGKPKNFIEELQMRFKKAQSAG